jgi:hypothetical protein
MEAIPIDEYKELIIMEDLIVFVRNDMIRDELKKQIYLFSDLRNTHYQPASNKIYWIASFFAFLFTLLSLSGDPIVATRENARIKLFLKDGTSKYLDCGELSNRALNRICKKINRAMRIWKKQNLPPS